MRIRYEGEPRLGVTAKDLILGTIGQMGIDGAVGHVVEYAGPAIEALSMEGRMTICNMTIEGGGRAGMIAPDETTFAYLEGRPGAPRTSRRPSSAGATCAPTTGAAFDREIVVDVAALAPQVTWGTTPARSCRSPARCPSPQADGDERALEYMGLEAGHADARTSRSTASSSARARTAASATCAPPPRVVEGRKVAGGVHAMVVPGSDAGQALQAEAEGLDEVFRAAGFDWRDAGCSMCLGMNPDILAARRALRLDLQPQLRGPPGPRRPHPPRLARRWPPPPRSRATSSTSGSWS